ncbi:MmgE/PrpD family protein [Zavarzinia sp. CC-PAN008]|uniref:MmgE/PrpD family protein n=1 Tax=Zavarzinia sp. CC-PAN008 TaxID=3243332 RepID=UPI003F7438F6
MSAVPLALQLAAFARNLGAEALPGDVVARAQHCLLDWMGVTLAGSGEPLARILRDEIAAEGGVPEAAVIGAPLRLPVAKAALVNGTAGHALDYDDVISAALGHPTVAVAPVVLALGEECRASGVEVVAAFVAGVEVICRMGGIVGAGHYEAGFHATGTLGAFGAAAAAARLLKLDDDQAAHAFGIVATTASGLKSMFGTMCKPLHAGHAAEMGLRAARLAARGFTARTDAIECAQGFATTHHGRADAADTVVADGVFHLRDVLFKFHASCYGTHAAIEAARTLRQRVGPELAVQADAIRIALPAAALKMCVIPEPRTGLEAKFSVGHVTAAALLGIDTAALDTFADDAVGDPRVALLRRRVSVVAETGQDGTALGGLAATVDLHLPGGRVERAGHDAGIPERDLAQEQARLHAKFMSLATPLIGGNAAGAAADMVLHLGHAPSLAPLIASCAA